MRATNKGGTVVVLDSELYRWLTVEMLKNDETYVWLPNNPTDYFQRDMKNLLTKGVDMGVLTSALADKLYVDYPMTPVFYTLPKIHKQCSPPPLMPTVAGVERLGSWIDHLLQPLIFHLPGFLQDSKDVVFLLEGMSWSQSYHVMSLLYIPQFQMTRQFFVCRNIWISISLTLSL